ncbi:MAG: hypothetical protein WA190_00205 [Usitatibacter sp.]
MKDDGSPVIIQRVKVDGRAPVDLVFDRVTRVLIAAKSDWGHLVMPEVAALKHEREKKRLLRKEARRQKALAAARAVAAKKRHEAKFISVTHTDAIFSEVIKLYFSHGTKATAQKLLDQTLQMIDYNKLPEWVKHRKAITLQRAREYLQQHPQEARATGALSEPPRKRRKRRIYR